MITDESLDFASACSLCCRAQFPKTYFPRLSVHFILTPSRYCSLCDIISYTAPLWHCCGAGSKLGACRQRASSAQRPRIPLPRCCAWQVICCPKATFNADTFPGFLFCVEHVSSHSTSYTDHVMCNELQLVDRNHDLKKSFTSDGRRLRRLWYKQVNPTNPTGEYLEVEALKRHIEESCRPGTTVLVDESMQVVTVSIRVQVTEKCSYIFFPAVEYFNAKERRVDSES